MGAIEIALALAQFAPGIIGMLKGPKAEELASKVVGVASTVAGVPGPQALEAIKANQEMSQQFQIKMFEIQAAEIRAERDAEVAAGKDARAMQVAALQQDDLFSKRFAYYFAITWTLFGMAYFVGVTLVDLEGSRLRFADTILGLLIGTIFGGIFSWVYGSVSRNAHKDATIAALAEAASK